MKIRVSRYANGKDSTAGLLYVEGEFFCHTLEDEYREKKVAGETRIPAGKYEIVFREEPSPSTMKYRERYDWFHWHIMLKDVPNFSYIYIHPGTKERHTDGCILVNYNAAKLDNNEYECPDYNRSVECYRKLYAAISRALKADEKVFIEIN